MHADTPGLHPEAAQRPLEAAAPPTVHGHICPVRQGPREGAPGSCPPVLPQERPRPQTVPEAARPVQR